MFDRIKSLLTRWHEIKEVDSLTDRDLDDLGMSRAQVRAFARMPQDISERVAAMGSIFGVPAADLKRDQAQWIELLAVCGHCADRGACGAVLARASQSRPADAGFCPNRDSFAGMANTVA